MPICSCSGTCCISARTQNDTRSTCTCTCTEPTAELPKSALSAARQVCECAPCELGANGSPVSRFSSSGSAFSATDCFLKRSIYAQRMQLTATLLHFSSAPAPPGCCCAPLRSALLCSHAHRSPVKPLRRTRGQRQAAYEDDDADAVAEAEDRVEWRMVSWCDAEYVLANVLVASVVRCVMRGKRGTYALGECHPREQHGAHAFDGAVRQLVRASLVAVDTPIRHTTYV